MQLVMYSPSASAVWADALFVSVLQDSDKPDAGQVRRAIAAAVRAYGGGGCAQRVAQEFGDHPEIAVARMRWARAVAGQAFALPPGPVPDDARRRPGQAVAGPAHPEAGQAGAAGDVAVGLRHTVCSASESSSAGRMPIATAVHGVVSAGGDTG